MKKTLLALAVASIATSAFADNKQETSGDDIEHITIISHTDKLRTESGSTTLLTEVELEKFEYDDIHRILSKVPGVNIREEDGYGLRPNIGFRGVTPERSKKITIMEDGVLIGPSPYSASAAYYFPVPTRMTAVEVFKGPAAIKHGPQTIAGALNFVTRQVPEFTEGGIDIARGTDGYQKVHGHFGSVVNNVGFLVEGVNLKADGFKDLDGGGNTGFDKNDLLAKFNYQLTNDGVDHTFGLKLSYANEKSDETYLGLTDADFAENPYRRYAATQPALMDTKHQQIMFSHNMSDDNLSMTTRVYRHDYERAWLKLSKLVDHQTSLSVILANPEKYEREYAVLSGNQNSVESGSTTHYLLMGTNDREYFSQGIQVDGNYNFSIQGVDNKLAFGVRLHEDEIERKHFTETYEMEDGFALKTAEEAKFTTTNIENTKALSVYIEDTLTLGHLTVSAGIRGESMDMYYTNKKNADEWQKKKTTIWLPGVSGFYQLNDDSGLLFGVYQGFVPSSPKQPADIEVEKSVNYEFGGRFNDGITQFEAVAFFNDYSNLKESCGFSNCGIDEAIDQEFNGSEVDVYGLETQFSQRYPLNLQIDIPYGFVYTFTRGEFKSDFTSDFDQWGRVTSGDNLPYVPEHQFAFNIGLEASEWYTNLSIKNVSSMKERAGVLVDDNGDIIADGLNDAKTDSAITVDISAGYDFDKYGRIYLKIDNLLDEDKVVSRRPYGARPGKPRQVIFGYKYQF